VVLSGSFTLTGSFKVDGDVLGTTTGTSSTSDNTEYTLFTPSTDYSPYAVINQTNALTLQFYHTPAATLNNVASYRITMGEPITATTARGGVTLPIDCTIRGAYVSISSETPGTNENGGLIMVSGSTTLHSFVERPIYNKKFTSFIEGIGLSYSAGTSIAFVLTTPPWVTAPLNVTHNITLYIRPN
jgi:hypothetical protein